MVGLIEDVSVATPMTFREADDAIVLLGEPTEELGASEYLAWIHGVVAGAPPACDLARERALIETLHESIQALSCTRRTIAAKAALPWRSPNAASRTR